MEISVHQFIEEKLRGKSKLNRNDSCHKMEREIVYVMDQKLFFKWNENQTSSTSLQQSIESENGAENVNEGKFTNKEKNVKKEGIKRCESDNSVWKSNVKVMIGIMGMLWDGNRLWMNLFFQIFWEDAGGIWKALRDLQWFLKRELLVRIFFLKRTYLMKNVEFMSQTRSCYFHWASWQALY